MDPEERLAVFLDYENLALGARDNLGGMSFDFRPIGDALAERGRLVVRRAYADWSYFDEDRRMLTRSHVELIEITQRMGAVRKNAADIKLAVDALELAVERDYISTFVVGTGDSDFTPLVHKLRELNKRVIGVGVEQSTSALLPPACDEFLYYDRLEGVEVPVPSPRRRRPRKPSTPTPEPAATEAVVDPAADTAADPVGEAVADPVTNPVTNPVTEAVTDVDADLETNTDADTNGTTGDTDELAVRVAQTVAGLERSASGQVSASMLKRTLLRKDPTFSEADYGFRAFGELLTHLADRNVVELTTGPSKGDPEVSLPEHGDSEEAFGLLRSVLADHAGPVVLSGLKNQLRKVRPDFSEKKLGYRSFLQFCKAARTRTVVDLVWDAEADDYVLTLPSTSR